MKMIDVKNEYTLIKVKVSLSVLVEFGCYIE